MLLQRWSISVAMLSRARWSAWPASQGPPNKAKILARLAHELGGFWTARDWAKAAEVRVVSFSARISRAQLFRVSATSRRELYELDKAITSDGLYGFSARRPTQSASGARSGMDVA